MRTIVRTAAILAALTSVAFAGPAFAQRWRGSGGWGPGGAYDRLYDPAKVVTVEGVVTAVHRITPRRGMRVGVHLTLRTTTGLVDVHLGPAWFIDNQDLKLVTGDTLSITGARIVFQGKPAIIAARIQKGDRVLVLRDGTGRPVWAAWRARPAG